MSCEAFLGKILLKKLLVKKSHFDYYAKKNNELSVYTLYRRYCKIIVR